ncbi:hypothetical protein BDK63_000582 [Halomonas campaniensis]|uniref:Uncharacterized protein n=1 Tax=Halomonas campaniensis TaxID=213554 RepID=A0A7W5K0L0_9GAMM|nr:hypothetical protein [Halomonas campaniensis]
MQRRECLATLAAPDRLEGLMEARYLPRGPVS